MYYLQMNLNERFERISTYRTIYRNYLQMQIIKIQEENKVKKADYLILGAAFISFLFSISLWFGIFGADQKLSGIFVGLWVPSIIGLGNYFKLKTGDR